ncbi:hypothetical protein SBRCBS47491_002131 [Sporothrix bragantina]|uniref:HAUS augmin-like complex subunit 6 N-terminal domain-containing protein n=1 Tax=Sporothrix bragantina TaxID=671064 RepID=A0ABP0B4D6_9PEZI
MDMASSTSLLSRTRSGRLPSGKPAASRDAVTAPISAASSISSFPPTSTHSSSLFLPASNVAVFLTNLRLLDLDLLPDWPNISARTFSAKDVPSTASSQNGQKRRIQSVEWALYHLFCLWDPDEARAKMQPLFPPADQVQSVTLRAAFLRGLEAAKKTGALGRDAILRKTMLDECRGERFEEILAVFSSAVLKRVVEEGDESTAVAKAVALENRGYSAERTQLHALILAHKASLCRTLRQKEVARARYHDFAELLALKERSLVRRRELAKAMEEEEPVQVSEDVKLRLQRLVRNNWSGSEAWMQSLVHGDELTSKDGLLSTPADRVWRRVQAGRLGELESRTDTGLLDQLDRRVTAQRERLHQWREYRQHVLRKQPQGSTTATATKKTPEALKTKKAGIDFGFDAHSSLHPTLSPRKGAFGQQQHREETPAPPRNDDYDSLLKSFQDEMASVHQPRQGPSQLTSFLDNARKTAANRNKAGGHERKTSRAAAGVDEDDDETESDISDMDEHPIVVQQQQQQRQLSAPPSEDSESPTRRRVLLTKKSMTFSVKSYQSDDEPSPPREFLPAAKKIQRAATIQIEQPLPPAVRKLSGQMDNHALAIRRRQQSPPIRPPRNVASAPPPPPAPRTPSPDRSPPPPTPPSDDDGPFELVSTPQHSILLQPPPASDAASSTGASPTQDLADQILSSMNNASPSPIKRPRHTLSLAERTRMSMARASRVGGGARPMESDDEDESFYDDENAFGERQTLNDPLALRRQPNTASLALRNKAVNNKTAAHEEENNTADDPDGLIARTRKSMAGFEAARQKAQLDRRRSMRKSRQSSLGVGSAGAASAATSTATSRREAAAHGGYFPSVDEGDDNEPEDTTMLAEELMSGGQDDAEAIFRSRPKIKMSPIPSPTRELEFD